MSTQPVPNVNQDQIAVFNGFQQVFAHARPMRDSVAPRTRMMDHPLETGQIISDYKITMPVEIEIVMVITAHYYRDTYNEIWNLWQQSTLLTVQTKAASYANMVITDPPHDERPEMFDAITMRLRFRQVMTPTAINAFSPKDPTQADTAQNGQQSGTNATIQKGTAPNQSQSIESSFGRP